MTSVKQCARASYVEIYWFLSISTTDVTTCDATDVLRALVWPQQRVTPQDARTNPRRSSCEVSGIAVRL
jgi:hypothetical protein